MEEILKNKKYILIGTLLIVTLDQLTKALIRLFLGLLDRVTIIKNFFYLTYTTNTGGAWSILEGKQWIFIIIGILFMTFLITNLKKEEKITKISIISNSLMLGGMMGNLIDRIFLKEVTDFLSFRIGTYYFPVFNLADMAIVIGVIIWVIEIIRDEKEGEYKNAGNDSRKPNRRKTR